MNIAVTTACTSLTLVLMVGCATTPPVAVEIPARPTKPQIKSSVIIQNQIPYIGYTVDQAIKLIANQYDRDAYEEKLRYRLETVNKYLAGK